MPDEQDSSGRWSLDHLFLDQDAIPTLVEVKRSSDTRIRREVIGQMLDYAANAVAHWPVEEIKAKFESPCKDDGDDPETELARLFGKGQDTSTFWSKRAISRPAARGYNRGLRRKHRQTAMPREFANMLCTYRTLLVIIALNVASIGQTDEPAAIGSSRKADAFSFLIYFDSCLASS